MLHYLNFFGNHNLDFENNDIDTIENNVISELRNISIPDEVLPVAYDSFIRQFCYHDMPEFWQYDAWYPISFTDRPGFGKFPKKHIVTFGPMGLHLVITPHHIKLPAVVYERGAWYSPQNKETVQTLRSYYHTIINHFGGDHALYVDECLVDKYFNDKHLVDGSALNAFEQTLIDHYGPIKQPMFSFTANKLPKYYIDPVTTQQ
jgi:hypothetical protein